MKTVWITAFNKDRDAARVSAASQLLARYGLAAQGHFWVDESAKLAWRVGLDALDGARADLWLILADADDMAKSSVRYGLSLFAVCLREARGADFPMVVSSPSGMDADILPAQLQSVMMLTENSAAWPAKIVARAHFSAANPATSGEARDYRFEVIGEEQIGQWFVIGPRAGEWNGIMFGVHGGDAKIDFQAVGSRGALPEKTVLEYAQQGLTLQAGGREFSAWALRNRIDASASYYARVRGTPDAVLFMPYAENDAADATMVQLV